MGLLHDVPRGLGAGWPRTAAAMTGLLVLYGAWQLLGEPAGDHALVGNTWFALFALCQLVTARSD